MSRGKLELIWTYYFDHTTMEQHFEKMARKGWILDRMGIFWHYRRSEPKELRYAVGYFPGSGFLPARHQDLATASSVLFVLRGVSGAGMLPGE